MRKTYKILVPRKIGIPSHYMTAISNLGLVTYYDFLLPDEKETKTLLEDANILVTSFTKITPEIFSISPLLDCVITTTVGTDLIDLLSAKERNIKIVNCPTQNADAVVSLTITFILALSRRIIESNQSIKGGEWNPIIFRGVELKGRNLGIIGYGVIGKKVAIVAQALGMNISWVNSKSDQLSLEKLLSESDFISIHVPLNNSTVNLLNEDRLKMIKNTSYIINTARGAVVDSRALFNCLKENKIAGVALDVFENEPHNQIVSENITKLVSLPNVIATPHLGFNTHETFKRMGEELVLNIESFIDGHIINEVNI
jgi:phosphoglycerate dehydrogenase-like enzyme